MEKALEVLIKNLDFTNSNKQLDEIKSILSSTPEKNQQKIQKIKQDMANGDYLITSSSIADKLLQKEIAEDSTVEA